MSLSKAFECIGNHSIFDTHDRMFLSSPCNSAFVRPHRAMTSKKGRKNGTTSFHDEDSMIPAG